MARGTGVPPVMSTAAVAAPVVNEPSTVRSGKSRMRKVRYTPSAMTA